MSEIQAAILAIVSIFIIVISVWMFQSSIEAEVYNRETQANITTWEAMWTNLRVDCR